MYDLWTVKRLLSYGYSTKQFEYTGSRIYNEQRLANVCIYETTQRSCEFEMLSKTLHEKDGPYGSVGIKGGVWQSEVKKGCLEMLVEK